MWWILASAPRGAATTCGEPEILAVSPADGEVVSPAERIEVTHAAPGCSFPVVTLVGEATGPVPFETWLFDTGLVLVPTEPLPEGVYHVDGATWSGEQLERHATFTVSAAVPPPPPPPPPELAIEADRACDGHVMTTSIVVTATFEEDPGGWAVLFLDVSTEQGRVGAFEDQWFGQATLVHELHELFGGREACVAARLETEHGEELWRGEACAEPFGCPAPPRVETGGCGCAWGPRPSWGLLAAPLLLRRRRRA